MFNFSQKDKTLLAINYRKLVKPSNNTNLINFFKNLNFFKTYHNFLPLIKYILLPNRFYLNLQTKMLWQLTENFFFYK